MTTQRAADVVLKQIYYKLEAPGSFSGVDSLWRSARLINPKIKRSQVQNFLDQQKTHLIHRRPRKLQLKARDFNRFVATVPGFLSCDSLAFPDASGKNKFASVCSDALTNYLLVAPQPNLKASTTKATLEKLFRGQKVHSFYSDLGKEYASSDHLPGGIVHKRTHGRQQKAGLAEKLNSVIRAKLEKYKSANKLRRVKLADVLPKIAASYNYTPNRSIGNLTPAEVWKNRDLSGKAFGHKFATYLAKREAFARPKKGLAPGVLVRILNLEQSAFAKKARPGFKTELYRIKQVRQSFPPTYIVETTVGKTPQTLKGYFRSDQLAVAERQQQQLHAMSFCVTLSSGERVDDMWNSKGQFTVLLQRPLDFHSLPHEVAVTNLSFDLSIQNVTDAEIAILYRLESPWRLRRHL